MVFVGLVPAVVGEQAVGQAVGQTVFCNAVTAHSVVGASRFRAHTFGDVRALHSLFLYVFLHLVSFKQAFQFSQLFFGGKRYSNSIAAIEYGALTAV